MRHFGGEQGEEIAKSGDATNGRNEMLSNEGAKPLAELLA